MISMVPLAVYRLDEDNQFMLGIACIKEFYDDVRLELYKFGRVTWPSNEIEQSFDFILYTNATYDPNEVAEYLVKYGWSLI